MPLGIYQGASALSWAGLRFNGLESNSSKTFSLQIGAGVVLLSIHCYVAFKALNWQSKKLLTDVPDTRACSRPLDDVKNRGIRISKLLIHPIKSCRGTSVKEANFTPQGLENDRLWCIADAETNAVLTAREHSRMVLIHPTIHIDSLSPHGGMLVITFPEDSGCETLRIPLRPSEGVLKQWKTVENAKLWSDNDINCYVCEALSPTDSSPSIVLSRFMGKPVNLLFKGPRIRHCEPTTLFPQLDASLWFQDGYPLLILSEESTSAIEKEAQKYVGQQGIHERWREEKISIERFRPNIVISGAGPFAEDSWKEIIIESATQLTQKTSFSVVSLCARCLMPNIDIRTGVRDPAVPYKVLTKFRSGLKQEERFKPCAGCNAVPNGSGVLRVGDKVIVHQLMTKN